MRLVLQVSPDDIGFIGIPLGERLPGTNPIRFGETVLSVPKVVHETIICLRVVIKDDHQALPCGLVNDYVHHLLWGLACQRCISTICVIDATGCRCSHRLQREGQPHGVEALGFDLRQHLLVVATP